MTRFLSILFALAPLAFGGIRALNASDFRVLWMAVVSGIVVASVVMLRRSRENRSSMALGRALLALLLGMTAAAAAAFALGARAWFGMFGMGFVLAFCWVLSFIFAAVARHNVRTA